MYSDWDAALGHYRRYRPAELREHATAAGFVVTRMSYWNGFTFPAAVCVRGWEKLFPRQRAAEFPRVSRAVNSSLLTMASMERWWLRRMPAPCGVSLFAVLTRPADETGRG